MVFGTSSLHMPNGSHLFLQRARLLCIATPFPAKTFVFDGVPQKEQMVPCFNSINLILICAYGVMDSTMVFGTICSGSNPDRRTKNAKK